MPFPSVLPSSFPVVFGEPVGATVDHESEAVARLITAFRETNVEDLVRALSAAPTSAEYALARMHNRGTLALGAGAQLDGLGRIVGEGRNSLGDSAYQTRIRARVQINKSSGTIPQFLAILRLCVASDIAIGVREEFPAAITFLLSGRSIPDRDALTRIKREVKAGGVRTFLDVTNETDDNTFTLDSALSSQGLDAGTLSDTLE